MLLNDWQIRARSHGGMIRPFVDYTDEKPPRTISYGLSSSGYDIRLGTEFILFENAIADQEVLDPKDFNVKLCKRFITEHRFEIPPNSYILGVSIERFKMPEDVMAVCVGKSTYARTGVGVNVTPLEPEWEGFLTLEIFNATAFKVAIYPLEGIAQLLFHQIDSCERSYRKKAGKYQSQVGITLPKVI